MSFKKTTLYEKSCLCGCNKKYFGKTTQKNVHKYTGSGIYWKAHLNKHKCNYTTKIIGVFHNKFICEKASILYSNMKNIVENKEYFNLKIENGLDGGTDKGKNNPNYGKLKTEKTKQKMRKPKKNTDNMRKPKTDKHKQKLSELLKGENNPMYCKTGKNNPNYGKQFSDKHKQKLRKPKQIIKCPYCNKEGGSNGIKRWHFDKCKNKP